jgi:hypothetical protein
VDDQMCAILSLLRDEGSLMDQLWPILEGVVG